MRGKKRQQLRRQKTKKGAQVANAKPQQSFRTIFSDFILQLYDRNPIPTES